MNDNETKPAQVRPTRSEQRLAAVRASNAPCRLLRLADVQASVGLSGACIYKMIKQGNFPAPVKLTSKTSAWLASELDTWIESRALARQSRAA